MWSLQDDCKAQSVKHGLSSEGEKIFFIYQILTVIYVLYDTMEKCIVVRQLRSNMWDFIVLIINDLQLRL